VIQQRRRDGSFDKGVFLTANANSTPEDTIPQLSVTSFRLLRLIGSDSLSTSWPPLSDNTAGPLTPATLERPCPGGADGAVPSTWGVQP